MMNTATSSSLLEATMTLMALTTPLMGQSTLRGEGILVVVVVVATTRDMIVLTMVRTSRTTTPLNRLHS